jgi:uncharacterized protein YqgQ
MSLQTQAQDATFRVLNALAAIQRWEHWHEIQLCAQKEYAMSAETFYQLLPEYQRFIALAAGYEGIGMLSSEVDKLWHAHILNTKRYYDFCQRYLGHMVHHLPCSSYVLYGLNANDQSTHCDTPSPPTSCGVPPTCNVMDNSETNSEMRTAIITAGDNFYQAYRACYGITPSPDVWERITMLSSAEGVTIQA